jgi:methionine aminopeptidase
MHNISYSDLGAHVDGFIAVVAHTIVLGATSEAKVTGRRADVVLAAHYASQAALRLLKPGNEVSMLRCCNVILRGCSVSNV